jgi:hypothetical protein
MSALVVPTKNALKGLADVLKSVALTAVDVVNVLYSPFSLATNTVGAIGTTLTGGQTSESVQEEINSSTSTESIQTQEIPCTGGRMSRTRKVMKRKNRSKNRSKSKSRSRSKKSISRSHRKARARKSRA